MRWLRRCVALLLTCGVPALALVVIGRLMTGWNGVGVFAIGLVLAPGGLIGGLLVGVPGLLWLDRTEPDRPWPGLAIGALAGIVALAVSFALLGIFTQPDSWSAPAMRHVVVATYILGGGAVLGLAGTLLFRGIDRVLAATFLGDR